MKRFFATCYLRLRRALRGKGLSKIKFLRTANFAIEKFLRGKRLPVIRAKGLTIWLDPKESVAGKLEPFRPASTFLVERDLKSGDVFVDVGASIGWFTLLAAKIVGTTGKIYAFEPEPNSFSLLQKNVKENGFEDRVVLSDAAVAADRGTASFYAVGNAWVWASLEDPRKDYYKKVEANFRSDEDKTVHEYRVATVKLDDVLPPKVDFVKIDVATGGEAAENVVRGMTQTIKRNPQLKVLVTLANQGVVDMLTSFGYGMERVSHNHSYFFK